MAEGEGGHEVPGPRRRPVAGGYARGDAKYLHILEAAIRRFGDEGYAGASTRAIAQDAGVNPPALQYYFGGKAGLYVACRNHVVEALLGMLGDEINSPLHASAPTPTAALQAFLNILDKLAEFLFKTAEDRGWRRFLALIRTTPVNPAALKGKIEALDPKVFELCCYYVGHIIGASPESDKTRLKTIAAMGLLTGFHLERDLMLLRMEWQSLDDARLKQFKAAIKQSAIAILKNMP